MASPEIRVVNLKEKFEQFSELWSPRIVGELNGQMVKLARLEGEFVWHAHEGEDELFYVVEGQLELQFRDHKVSVGPGEFAIVPRGVEHKPVALTETLVMLFEPATTLNTGDATDERTVAELTVAELERL